VSGLPLDFFVSTDYADGTPAQCDVQIKWAAKPPKSPNSLPPTWELPLRRVHTNRYGLAMVRGLKIPALSNNSEAYLSLLATGRGGTTGQDTQ
jgi:hypothetical protein